MKVKAPDGKVIGFPDSMSQADVETAMGRLYPERLNPHPDPYEEIAKTGLRPQAPTVGGVVGPLAVMGAPFAGPALGAAGRAAGPSLQALEVWAKANPAKARALYRLVEGTAIGAALKYLPSFGGK